MRKSTQLAVIGGGPGGYTAAFSAADIGLDVTLIDREDKPGGVCLFRGCIPSKALLHVAKVLADARAASAWGVEFGEPTIDIERLRAWKDKVVGRLTGGLVQLTSQRDVSYLAGDAELIGSKIVRVTTGSGETTELEFDHAILATGSRPVWPSKLLVESDFVWDSTKALEVPVVPESLLVVGGGYIGLELGSVYATLGSAVTVVEKTDGLLPGVDRDLTAVVARRLSAICNDVLLETNVTTLTEDGDGVMVTLEGPAVGQFTRRFDRVLVAVGRAPNSDIPGLNATGVRLDKRGFVLVDGQRRTHEPSIFAVGDVAGEPMLAHKASHEARTAVGAIAGQTRVFKPAAIPAVVFTDPEVAWCGMTEVQAGVEGRSVRTCRYPWAASGRAATLDRQMGVTKLIVDPESEVVLGAGIAGAGAGELIAEAVVAIEMGATVSDLRFCVHPHPTLSETWMESADIFFGQSTHVYRPKRLG